MFLDEALERKAKRYALKEGISLAAVVREAVAAYVATPRRKARVPTIAGSFSSGHADTSERVDELLWTDPHR